MGVTGAEGQMGCWGGVGWGEVGWVEKAEIGQSVWVVGNAVLPGILQLWSSEPCVILKQAVRKHKQLS